jgi:hypothetical protein
MVMYRPGPGAGPLPASSASRVRDAAAEVGAPVVRAEEPLDDEPADPADGSRDLVELIAEGCGWVDVADGGERRPSRGD